MIDNKNQAIVDYCKANHIDYPTHTIQSIKITGINADFVAVGELCRLYDFNPIESIHALENNTLFSQHTHFLPDGVYIDVNQLDEWIEWNEQRIVNHDKG
ncbi:hypothetical protein [Cysteiniphilum sp. 6C5]|uniref:hypothetical protein n=1 Tax=unclassified Cysteiniphilum TaxID=2610889 RepID=UPI003F86D988